MARRSSICRDIDIALAHRPSAGPMPCRGRVRGSPNVGRSQTIRRVFDELRQEAKVIDPGRGYKEVRGGILEIDGVKVGFNSPGDVADPLEEDLNRLIQNNCSVIVCAARRSSYGTSVTFQAVKRCAAQAQPSLNVVLIEKQADADHAAGNRQKVEEIQAAARPAVAEAQQAELVQA